MRHLLLSILMKEGGKSLFICFFQKYLEDSEEDTGTDQYGH